MKRACLFLLLIPFCIFLVSLNEIPETKSQPTIKNKIESSNPGIDLCMTWGNPNNIVTRFHVGPSIAAVLIAIFCGGEIALRKISRKK